jgi:hypothetical protein
MTFDAVITPKDDGSLDPLALRPDDDFLTKYWGEWYLELHHGKLPPRQNHCAAPGAEANCGTGGAVHDRSVRRHPSLRRLPRSIANILEIESFHDIWGSSPVLNEVRDLAIDARTRLNEHEDGKYFTFCLGVAEKQVGDPLGIYPQAALNAKSIRRSYELLQIGERQG